MESFEIRIQLLAVQLVPFIMAVVFHEFAHGFVAYYWGDRTAKDAGRLTLNPVPHLDPIGTILFPIINMLTGMNLLFGWARPVPINPTRFKNYRHGLFWVSLAGPGMNFLLANLSAVVLYAMVLWVPSSFYLREPLIKMTEISIYLNYALGIFNLLPIPPLDGSKIVESFLSYNASRQYMALGQYSFYIFMGLLLTGAFSYILSPPIYFFSHITLTVVGFIFRVPSVSF